MEVAMRSTGWMGRAGWFGEVPRKEWRRSDVDLLIFYVQRAGETRPPSCHGHRRASALAARPLTAAVVAVVQKPAPDRGNRL